MPCHPYGITGFGNPDGGVMFIGIAPGYQEARTGRPFVGPSGNLLDGCLTAAAWPRSKCYVTNAVCWHPTDEQGVDRDPTPEEIALCWPRVEAEIRAYKPRLIITVGRVPTQAFFRPEGVDVETIGSTRGLVSWNTTYNCYVMPIYHPAAVLHGANSFIHDIQRDLNKVMHIVNWGPPDAYPWDWREVQTLEEAEEILRSIPRLDKRHFDALTDPHAPHPMSWHEDIPVCWLDIETGAVEIDEVNDVFQHPLLEFSICFDKPAKFAYVFPGELILPPAVKGSPPLSNIKINHSIWSLLTERVLFGFWGGQSDALGLLKSFGWRVPIHRDLMLESYLLDERQGVHTLKRNAREYVPGTGFWEQPIKDARTNWRREQQMALKDQLAIKTAAISKTGKGYRSMRAEVPDDVRSWYAAELLRIKNAGYEVIPKDVRRRYNAEDAIRTARLRSVLGVEYNQQWRQRPIPSCNFWPGATA